MARIEVCGGCHKPLSECEGAPECLDGEGGQVSADADDED